MNPRTLSSLAVLLLLGASVTGGRLVTGCLPTMTLSDPIPDGDAPASLLEAMCQVFESDEAISFYKETDAFDSYLTTTTDGVHHVIQVMAWNAATGKVLAVHWWLGCVEWRDNYDTIYETCYNGSVPAPGDLSGFVPSLQETYQGLYLGEMTVSVGSPREYAMDAWFASYDNPVLGNNVWVNVGNSVDMIEITYENSRNFLYYGDDRDPYHVQWDGVDLLGLVTYSPVVPTAFSGADLDEVYTHVIGPMPFWDETDPNVVVCGQSAPADTGDDDSTDGE